MMSRLCEYCREFDVRSLMSNFQESPFSRPKADQTRAISSKRKIVYYGNEQFSKHHPNLMSLKIAAGSCDLCHAIWREYSKDREPSQITDEALSHGPNTAQIYIGCYDWDTGMEGVPHVAVINKPRPTKPLACFDICVEKGQRLVQDQIILAKLQARSSSDLSCFNLAHKWLETCLRRHTMCSEAFFQNIRPPTRLLVVGKDNSELIHLVDGSDCEYAALSYCWGTDQDLTLTHATEPLLRNGCPLSRFPATLRDAVISTRELGLSHIWIDALCIFQDQDHPDSKADWAREAARMRDVYSGATVTIEAAAAESANEGFLKERPGSWPYCRLAWGEDAPGVYLRPSVDVRSEHLLSSRIFTRGWTLQERLLAPRTLTFGPRQISFECADGYVDEVGYRSLSPLFGSAYLSKEYMQQLRSDRGRAIQFWRSLSHNVGLPNVVSIGQIGHRNLGWSNQGVLKMPGGWWATYYELWRGIIEQFAQRQLTNPGDRLPALSGLADEFQRTTGDTYIAGMWKSELVLSLAWQCGGIYDPNCKHTKPHNGPIRSVKPGEYIAPSWSWASVQGKISFFLTPQGYTERNKAQALAKVQHVDLEPRYSDDPLGAIKSGHIMTTVPFLTITNPFESPLPDTEFPALQEYIHRRHCIPKNDFIPEIHQHHKSHERQTFALIKLLHDHEEDAIGMLLVESCDGKDGFRRLCYLKIQMSPPEGPPQDLPPSLNLDDDTFRKFVGVSRAEARKEVVAVARQIRGARWEERTIILY